MTEYLPLINTGLLLIMIALIIFGVSRASVIINHITGMQNIIAGMLGQILRLLDQDAEGAAIIATNLSDSISRADATTGTPGEAADAALKSPTEGS